MTIAWTGANRPAAAAGLNRPKDQSCGQRRRGAFDWRKRSRWLTAVRSPTLKRPRTSGDRLNAEVGVAGEAVEVGAELPLSGEYLGSSDLSGEWGP